jgi:hypothetical protein
MDEELDRLNIIGGLLRTGNYEEAERVANSVESEWQRADSLAQVARYFVTLGQLDQAERLWKIAIAAAQVGEQSPSPQDSLDSSSTLWEIAEDMALAGAIESAYTVATAIQNDWKKQRAIEGIAAIRGGGSGSFYRSHNNEP